MKKMYMHTLDGRPAHFDPNSRQIYFSARGAFGAVRLVGSLKEIHSNERASAKTRRKLFGEVSPKFRYGWVNVLVEVSGRNK